MTLHRQREPRYGQTESHEIGARRSPRHLPAVLLMLAGLLLAGVAFAVLSIVSTSGLALGAFIVVVLAGCVAACVATWLVDRQAERELSAKLRNGPKSASDQVSAGGG